MNTNLLAKLQGYEYMQFGHRVFVTKMPFRILRSLFIVDDNVQRELDIKKRNAIRDFILQTVEEGTFYFSPFIFSDRGVIKKVKGEDFWEVEPGAKMAILDGQHRARALESALNKLRIDCEAFEEMGKTSKSDELKSHIEQLESYEIAMQVYLKLNQKEERQLFTDINTERKNAHQGTVIKYDTRDKYAEIVRGVIVKVESTFEIEKKLSRLTKYNTALTSTIVMKRCLHALFEGVLTHKEGAANFKYCREEEASDIAVDFFNTWLEIFPKQMADREKYVSGLTGIQIALAHTVYLLISQEGYSYNGALKKIKELKRVTTWRHRDPLFELFYDDSKKRVSGLSNRIGKLSEQFLRRLVERQGVLI